MKRQLKGFLKQIVWGVYRRTPMYEINYTLRNVRQELDVLRQQNVFLADQILDIRNLKPAVGSMGTMQGRTLDFAEEMCKKFSENDFQYYIDFGTLIGAVRHQDFIPWDDDFDVSVIGDDYEKIIAWGEREFKALNSRNALSRLSKQELEALDGEVFFLRYYKHLTFFKIHAKSVLKFDVFKMERLNIMETYESFAKATQATLVGTYHKSGLRETLAKLDAFNAKNSMSASDGDYLCYALGNNYWDFNYKTVPNLTDQDIFPLVDIKIGDKFFKGPRNYDKILSSLYGDIYSFPKDFGVPKH